MMDFLPEAGKAFFTGYAVATVFGMLISWRREGMPRSAMIALMFVFIAFLCVFVPPAWFFKEPL
jgi:hypothetical protein